jgi:hypothetical protein
VNDARDRILIWLEEDALKSLCYTNGRAFPASMVEEIGALKITVKKLLSY